MSLGTREGFCFVELKSGEIMSCHQEEMKEERSVRADLKVANQRGKLTAQTAGGLKEAITQRGRFSSFHL